MASEEDYRRIFQGIRHRGELPVLLDAVRDLYRIDEALLRRQLAKKVVKTPPDFADFAYHQGRLAGFLQVLAAFDEYAKLEPERQPSHRPNGSE